MKMSTMNISLPPAMAEFVRRHVERNYSDANEFVRDLIRQKMTTEVEKDLQFLRETGPAEPAPTEKDLADVLRIQRRVRKELNAGRV